MKFGRLTVVEFATRKNNRTYWKCQCVCGNTKIIAASHLVSGHTQSCGCMHNEKIAGINLLHGLSHNFTHRIWTNIKTRCFNHKNHNYSNYGGRGITMYSDWIDNFQAFYDYVSKLENFGKKGYTLDRIDNNGNYEPGNLRWADQKTQCRNTRKNILIDYNGKQMTLAEISEITGIKYGTLWKRFKKGALLFKEC